MDGALHRGKSDALYETMHTFVRRAMGAQNNDVLLRMYNKAVFTKGGEDKIKFFQNFLNAYGDFFVKNANKQDYRQIMMLIRDALVKDGQLGNVTLIIPYL